MPFRYSIDWLDKSMRSLPLFSRKSLGRQRLDQRASQGRGGAGHVEDRQYLLGGLLADLGRSVTEIYLLAKIGDGYVTGRPPYEVAQLLAGVNDDGIALDRRLYP